MSFIVRTVARTAAGKEIVRPRKVDKTELTVGRSPTSDLHLADLAVTLNHAVIRLASGGQVEVVATAGLPFVLDDSQTEHARFSAAQGADLRIGSHLLAFSLGEGEDKGSVVITVSRVGAISNASEEKEEAHVFSLAAALPGKRKMAWALAIIVLAIFLIWPLTSIHTSPTGEARKIAFHADELWTSGPLSQTHKSLENNCQACHVKAGESVRDEACVTCHETVHDHADAKKLLDSRGSLGLVGGTKQLVGGLFGIKPGRCVECHTEHQGTTAMPVTDERFCTNCHTGMSGRIQTSLKDTSDFGDNHPQFEPTIRFIGGTGQPEFRRVSLDAKPKEFSGLKFPHDMHLSKTNGVAQMAKRLGEGEGYRDYGKPLECANCHTPNATGASFVAVEMEPTCGACHALDFDQVDGTVRTLPHGQPEQVIADIRAFYRAGAPRPGAFQGIKRRRPGDFDTPIERINFAQTSAMHIGNADQAVRSVFSKGGLCFDCHTVQATGNPVTPYDVTPVNLATRYMKKGWFDHAAHSSEKCESCHAVEKSASSADVNLPNLANCQTCHGSQDAKKEVPSACAMCHDYHRTEFAPLAVRDHRTRGKAKEHIGLKKLKEAGAGI